MALVGYSYLVLTRPLGPMLLTLAMALVALGVAAALAGLVERSRAIPPAAASGRSLAGSGTPWRARGFGAMVVRPRCSPSVPQPTDARPQRPLARPNAPRRRMRTRKDALRRRLLFAADLLAILIAVGVMTLVEGTTDPLWVLPTLPLWIVRGQDGGPLRRRPSAHLAPDHRRGAGDLPLDHPVGGGQPVLHPGAARRDDHASRARSPSTSSALGGGVRAALARPARSGAGGCRPSARSCSASGKLADAVCAQAGAGAGPPPVGARVRGARARRSNGNGSAALASSSSRS